MYFTINKTGCTEREGLVQVRFDLFFDPGDKGYEDQNIDVPIIPDGGYPGEKDKDGNIIDSLAYIKWLKELPTEKRNNPFCCHFCQFEPGVTDEEILYVGELALDMAARNYPDLTKCKNLPVEFDRKKKAFAAARVASVLETDFVKIKTVGKYRVK